MTRQNTIDSIRENSQVTVLIVGGGINGIGVFRDLALQGIDVLLVDKSDFCAGASAASSHMLHGGLRYLENAEFRLVREALRERNLMLQNAPHYAKPLPTTIPIFNWFSGLLNAPLKFLRLRDKPGSRGALVVKIGLSLYDFFTRKQQVLPRHKFMRKKNSLKLRPHLNPNIICTATYYDAWMPYPERICMELIMDTELLSPTARALNYVAMEDAKGDIVTLSDEVTGEILTVKPKIVINAAGPWIDFTNKAMQHSTQFIGGTKGSHLVLDHPELHEATKGGEMFFENEDGRITLFFPLLDKVLIGTTDIPINNPEDAICSDEEIDYILSMIDVVFPNIKVDRSHIVFQFSGVRPLPRSKSATTGQVSRDHSVKILEPGSGTSFPIYSLIGGKWTTFRAFAEQVTDKILKRLGQTRQVSTENMSIGGGKQYPRTEIDQKQWLTATHKSTELPEDRLKTLFARYGTYTEDIAEFIIDGADEPLQHHPDYSRREILFLATHEKVVHLDDLLLRRTLIAMLGQLTRPLLDEIADILAQNFAWSAEKKQNEIDCVVELWKIEHGVDLS
jgi:glycerol-3-phosphate dehydrogenase